MFEELFASSNGRLLDSTVYDNGKKLYNQTFEYHRKNGIMYSNKLEDHVRDTKQKFTYDESGKLDSEVFFEGQRGLFKRYKDDVTKLDSVFNTEEIEASYPGGEQAWVNYVSAQIVKNAQALVKENISGTCRVRFVIDETGKTQDIKPLTMQNTLLAEVAINAIKRAPKWKPAVQYGLPAKAYREQPFTFSVKY